MERVKGIASQASFPDVAILPVFLLIVFGILSSYGTSEECI
jgi:hypothetical protein